MVAVFEEPDPLPEITDVFPMFVGQPQPLFTVLLFPPFEMTVFDCAAPVIIEVAPVLAETEFPPVEAFVTTVFEVEEVLEDCVELSDDEEIVTVFVDPDPLSVMTSSA
jgi:hypothetical protein